MGGVMRNKVAVVRSGALMGYDGALLDIETDLKTGLPMVQIVGMGSKAINEARQRVRSAISNSFLTFPMQKVIVNLAPAELPKDGTHLDLPIALGILVASKQLRQTAVDNTLFAGELALNGDIRPIRGAVLLAELAKKHHLKRLVVPSANLQQASLVSGIEIIGIDTLSQLFKQLKGIEKPPSTLKQTPLRSASDLHPTFDDVVGHESAKRALAIAAAGRHNILFSGPPGTGKTLLAKCLIGLLPSLTQEEVLEVTKLHSLAHGDFGAIFTNPPFRAPHHSVTLTALIGGGQRPRPGDLSLAHKGVLFLDELPEYTRTTLEALRQPIEDRVVHLSRVFGRISYPSDVLLVATMNPCPCGYYGDSKTQCSCSSYQIANYQKRISGPLLDRIDLRLTVTKVEQNRILISKMDTNEQHLTVLKMIKVAREAQLRRYNRSNHYNAYASLTDIQTTFAISPNAQQLLHAAAKKMTLSSRSYLRTIRVARTIADLDSSKTIETTHVAEALQYR